MSQHDDAMLAYLRNINTRPGPNAGRSIDPTKPGPDADRITELERRIADYREMIVKAENKDAPLTPLGLQVLEARRAQVEQWEAELARLRNEQQPGWDSIVHELGDAQPRRCIYCGSSDDRCLGACYYTQGIPPCVVDVQAQECRNYSDADAQSDAKPDDPLPREHRDPSKWVSRETMATMERAHAQPVAWRVRDFGDDWILCHSQKQAEREAESAGNLIQPPYTAPHRPDASGLVEAAEWLDRQATAHERDASDEPDDDKPVMTEGDCSKAIAGYLRKAAHNLRARAADRSVK
jgi:hypothetical protein